MKRAAGGELSGHPHIFRSPSGNEQDEPVARGCHFIGDRLSYQLTRGCTGTGGSGRLVFLAGLSMNAHAFDDFAPRFTDSHRVIRSS